MRLLENRTYKLNQVPHHVKIKVMDVITSNAPVPGQVNFDKVTVVYNGLTFSECLELWFTIFYGDKVFTTITVLYGHYELEEA